MAAPDKDPTPDDTLFVSKVSSRRPTNYALAAILWLPLLVSGCVGRDVLRLTVEQKETDGGTESHVSVHLKGGAERLLPPALIEPSNTAALLTAIRQAIPSVFVRHLG